MTCLPQPSPIFRPPRVRMTDFTPAVLRFHDGGCATGSLEVISPTGGLLCLPKSANRGSRVKLMFLTQMGPVLGSAELLSQAQVPYWSETSASIAKTHSTYS